MGYSYKSSRTSSVARKYARTGTGQRRTSTNRNAKRGRGQYIDPSLFVRAAKPADASDVYVPTHTFTDFALLPLLQTNIAQKGYVTPSPIQDQAIPLALSGNDVIGIASTGTGKTAAFALPVLQKLLTDKQAKALIIAPTRELAQQIEKEMQQLAKNSPLSGVLLIGGSSMGQQLRGLQRHPRIIIGTPGRIKDHLTRKSLMLDDANIIVLDEVDRMLDMGFLPDVKKLLEHVAEKRQCLFFSATMDTRIRALIDTFTHDPVTVSLKPSSSSDLVHQDVIPYASKEEKLPKLQALLKQPEVTKVIVFDETKYGVERLNKQLLAAGFAANSIHGGKTQGQRQRSLAQFKNDEVAILVATDVAARGIDVTGVSHVINFSLPQSYNDYIHRIGRAGRAGQVGHALTFVEHGTQATH